VLQLQAIRPSWLPEEGIVALWPQGPAEATKDLQEFCRRHLKRQLSFNDLRASFVTDCHEHGLTAMEEGRIVGHSAAVAEKHYSEYEAREARHKLPPDPLTAAGADEPDAVPDKGGDVVCTVGLPAIRKVASARE
jgi:hypothetical protein